MRRAGLTTVEALESLGLVSIFHALYDSMVAAESYTIIRLAIEGVATLDARTLACES